ncbi:hypothetical protein DVH05_017483 [Phytophthora capsici]|nr:hypothetical protein DVH05_017483 [Phytophthora capsici]
MPELRLQPFVPLVARLILNRQVADDSASGELVSFDVFMTILSVFNAKQALEFKRRVLFDIYDQENKGYTTVDDFLRVISEVSRPNAAQQKIICRELELHLAPFAKKSNGGVNGVLLSDFNQTRSAASSPTDTYPR